MVRIITTVIGLLLFFAFFCSVADLTEHRIVNVQTSPTMSPTIEYNLTPSARFVVPTQQEVAPYKFADLPHGRIYKAVHQGCELFIVESDFQTDYHNVPLQQHSYTVTLGRCQ
jgi:hypothetical protein